jgi:mannose-6-phosphate isomerase-like protein (cupin superfamily)
MKKEIILMPLSVIILIACQQKTENETKAAVEIKSKAYILHKDEGEITIDGQDRTNIIKVSPETGAAHLSMGIENHPKGVGTIVHRHDRTEEILFVHRGSGKAIINGDTVNIAEGATLFIPPGTWHGIENPDDSIIILFTTTPQGLEKLFRAIGSPPGVLLKKWTEQQMDSIERISDSRAKKKQ